MPPGQLDAPLVWGLATPLKACFTDGTSIMFSKEYSKLVLVFGLKYINFLYY
jgi:hypothetical protein